MATDATTTRPAEHNGNIHTDTLPGLLPHHHEELSVGSGLSDETIKASGIRSETDYRKLAHVLNRKSYSRKLGAGMVFPFCDETGAVVQQRVKPDNPGSNGKGKPKKYLSPVGAATRAYQPRGAIEAINTPKTTLGITEGEKKALKATQEGIPTIGLTGVENFHRKKSSALIADLERIDWKDREVLLFFDSDIEDNENVQYAETMLTDALKRRGAKVKAVRLPAGPGGKKQGLDDFLVANPVSELHRLIAEAQEPDPPDPGTARDHASKIDPATEAERFLESSKKSGNICVRFWRDTPWFWRGNRFVEWPDSEIKASLYRFLNRNYFAVTTHVVRNVLEQVKAMSIIAGRRNAPLWLEDGVPGSQWPADELLIAKNMCVHLPSLIDGLDCTAEPTPALFATSALAFDFEGANCPPPIGWMDFLGKLWPDDAESIFALQLWFGYCLTSDTTQQKMLGLFGPRRSGKGTIARVLRELLGKDSVAGPTLSSFATDFGLWPLMGKPLAIISDARLSNRTDTAIITERLLSITGEDALDISRKFKPTLTSVKLSTRLMLLSNELPRLNDSSQALAGRMIVLKLTESWYGKEDTTLTAALLEELPSILHWSIQGWRLLRERGRLLQPESSDELAREMERLSSPVKSFVDDRCEVGPEYEIERTSLYEAYRKWCEENGRKFSEDAAGFGRNLRAAVPGVRTKQPRQDGERVRIYVGVGLGEF